MIAVVGCDYADVACLQRAAASRSAATIRLVSGTSVVEYVEPASYDCHRCPIYHAQRSGHGVAGRLRRIHDRVPHLCLLSAVGVAAARCGFRGRS